MNDLDRFVKLYESFGITCKVYKDSPFSNQFITLIEPSINADETIDTISDKFCSDVLEATHGTFVASSTIWFDATGKFLSQNFDIS